MGNPPRLCTCAGVTALCIYQPDCLLRKHINKLVQFRNGTKRFTEAKQAMKNSSSSPVISSAPDGDEPDESIDANSAHYFVTSVGKRPLDSQKCVDSRSYGLGEVNSSNREPGRTIV
jgi:hypothetical protein